MRDLNNKITQKPALSFPDNNGGVLVKANETFWLRTLKFLYLTEFSDCLTN